MACVGFGVMVSGWVYASSISLFFVFFFCVRAGDGEREGGLLSCWGEGVLMCNDYSVERGSPDFRLFAMLKRY